MHTTAVNGSIKEKQLHTQMSLLCCCCCCSSGKRGVTQSDVFSFSRSEDIPPAKEEMSREFNGVGIGTAATANRESSNKKVTIQVDETKPDAANAELYQKHNGDIEAIFKELGENPEKALKDPPANAAEFERKYSEGLYKCDPEACPT